jgi:ribosomal protein S18 acetylase RimI-like enzyme
VDGVDPGPRIELRPAKAADEPLLARVFADARAGALRSAGLGECGLELLLGIQRRAQDAEYRAAYPQAEHLVVEADGAAVGRVVIDRRPGEHRIVDLALLAAWRGRGVGSSVLRALQADAAATGRMLGLRVARGNPAGRLYARLGFCEVAADEMYVEMAWLPGARGCVGDTNLNNRGAAA